MILTGGTVYTMVDGEYPEVASLVIEDGAIREIVPGSRENIPHRLRGLPIRDVSGLAVAPGFIDIHIHDECLKDNPVVQHAMLAQGVTAGLAGNCGSGPRFGDFAEMHPHPWVNLYSLVGNCVLREAAGQSDRYSPASSEQISVMRSILRESMEAGAMGLSLGLEYAPGASREEVDALSSLVADFNGLISCHIRYDDDRCLEAVRDVLDIVRGHGVRVQISHLGSMTSRYTAECSNEIASVRSEGLDVAFDCYPYAAFCANIGSAVFDDGFSERWNGKGAECLEALSGKFRGRRLDWDTFAEMREDDPNGLLIAYIMDEHEVEDCIAHPNCIVASDSFYDGNGTHPRTFGTFPKALGILRHRGYSLHEALKKMTSAPADAMRINSGRLFPGAVADIVVFNPENYRDRADYQNPFEPPSGVRMVIVRGHVALRDGKIDSAIHGTLRGRPGAA
jgi:N-acyl-D-amino-acid deacylase